MANDFQRPRNCHGGFLASTPAAAKAISLLGPGVSVGPNALTRNEFRAVKRLYGVSRETAQDQRVQAFMQSGADRNVMRFAQADGLRLLAWLAGHMEAGEDPLRALVQLAADAGWDVSPEDVSWAMEENEPDSV